MKKSEGKRNILFWMGLLLVLVSLFLFLIIFFSTIKNEIRYLFFKESENAEVSLKNDGNDDGKIIPVDNEFSIIIPKIEVNARVVANVDSQNEREYRTKLKEGVAHAKGSGLPSDDQTVFIFAHSSDNFYQNNQYNSIFYLLRKLKSGDNFYLIHKEKIYEYKTIDTKTVNAEEVNYLENNEKYDVVLMTCWPPGTSYKRLLVFGKQLSE